ncbi:hypothetical protein PV08_07413 [Exophiala spinifera]|uniref:C4-dicarboxylate transporter/malic acid transporter n=1 Tax=Exophiala spinifera TaxID=91928 RepID=A0A0D2BTR1_9EURO|nr:uncharacterized protein PV08_07413 [Exophiala spinifera]KIW14629.1 hypothetical protein PV08_07413 [Exophiala spinifera]
MTVEAAEERVGKDNGPDLQSANRTQRDLERNDENLDTATRSAFRALVEDFSPIWFTWCMNAGVIGVLLHQLPYQFSGLRVLSTVAFCVDLVLYIVFSVLYTLHFLIYRRQSYAELTGSVIELCLLPCWCIAWMTLTSFISLTVSNAPWGGHAFTMLAVVMWWIATAWMYGMLFFAFATFIRQHTIVSPDQQLPALIIIPAVGVSTLALVGAVVSSDSHDISARLAVPIIITSFCSVGIGILLGFKLTTYLFHQLLAKGWPAPANTPTLFMFIGPMGQSAAALQMLGSAANTHGAFGDYHRGLFLTGTAASVLEVACVLLALFMTALGAVWMVLALIGMLDRAVHGQLMWTPTWNAIIFPTGTLVTSLLVLAQEMDSPFFRVVTTIIVVFLVIVFFINLVFTLTRIWQGKLLIVKRNPRAPGKEGTKEK